MNAALSPLTLPMQRSGAAPDDSAGDDGSGGAADDDKVPEPGSEPKAARRGLEPRVRIVAQATSGLAPKWVMMTPVEAVRQVAAAQVA